MNKNKTSRFLSLVLRHDPDKIEIQLDEEGWVYVATLLTQMNAHGKRVDFEML